MATSNPSTDMFALELTASKTYSYRHPNYESPTHPTGQEQDDNKRVHDGEPLDVGVRHRVENVIPSGRPFDVTVLLPFDAVRIRNCQRFLPGAWNSFRSAHAFHLLASLKTFVTLGFNVDFDDASGRVGQEVIIPFLRLFRFVILDGEVDVIEHKVPVVAVENRTDDACVLLHPRICHVATNGKTF